MPIMRKIGVVMARMSSMAALRQVNGRRAAALPATHCTACPFQRTTGASIGGKSAFQS